MLGGVGVGVGERGFCKGKEYHYSNKLCFLNGAFQGGVFRGWLGSGQKAPKCMKTLVFSGILCPSQKGFPLSQAEVTNLITAVWKTPFGTLRHSGQFQVQVCLATGRALS